MNRPHAMHDFPAATPAAPRGFLGSWTDFWFGAVDPIGFHLVRMFCGFMLLAWLLPFYGTHEAFFSLGGWFDQQAYREGSHLAEGLRVPTSWSILYAAGTNSPLLTIIYWSSILCLVLFTLGILPQVTAILAWIIVASYTDNPAVSYDGDVLLLVPALYFMVGYVLYSLPRPGRAWHFPLLVPPVSWFVSKSPERVAAPSSAANLALRLFQVHTALIVCTSGFHKLQSAEWWEGVNFWYALHPALETTVDEARTHAGHAMAYLGLLSFGAYLTLAWQLAFPVYAWRPRWRLLLLSGAAIGWLGCAFLYRLPLFGPALLLGSLSFLAAEEWYRVIPGLRAWAQPLRRSETTRPTRKAAAVPPASRVR